VTEGRSGEGFAEVVRLLIEAVAVESSPPFAKGGRGDLESR
jgi:hypothetical protein